MCSRSLIALLAVILFSLTTLIAAPLGTSLTYQGVLSDSGEPMEGVFDLQFELWDAPDHGSQVASPVVVEDIAVSDGRVAVQVDFGDVFDETALWLAVALRDGAGHGDFSSLGARQPLTATPQARFAAHAATADNAVSADTAVSADNAVHAGDAAHLGGQGPAYFRAWSNLTGIPSGLNDGDDDTLNDISCAEDQIVRWTGSSWQCTEDASSPYVRTVVVGPAEDMNENGAALLAALEAIPEPAGRYHGVVLLVEPGSYYLPEGETLGLKKWIDIQGRGHGLSPVNYLVEISGTVCGTTPANSAILKMDHATQVSNVAVVNRCSDPGSVATAIYSDQDHATLKNVFASVLGGCEEGYGVVSEGSAMQIFDSTIYTTGCLVLNTGIRSSGSELMLRDVSVWVDGNDVATNAIAIHSAGPQLSLNNVTAASVRAANSYGIYSTNTENGSMLDVDSRGGSMGMFLDRPGPFLRMDRVLALGGAVGIQIRTPSGTTYPTNRAELRNVYARGDIGLSVKQYDQNLSVTFEHGYLHGYAHAASVLDGVLRIGGSQINLGDVTATGVGTATCAGVWNGPFAFFPNTCP